MIQEGQQVWDGQLVVDKRDTQIAADAKAALLGRHDLPFALVVRYYASGYDFGNSVPPALCRWLLRDGSSGAITNAFLFFQTGSSQSCIHTCEERTFSLTVKSKVYRMKMTSLCHKFCLEY